MPRKPRLLMDEEFYHILTRGNDRKKLFCSKHDYHYFLQIVHETLNKHPIRIYHYCLMKNHVHFVIKALDYTDVPKFFKILFQRYASYFRKRYDHVGFLFQNRYKSFHIKKESYLLECGRYVERNPVRKNMVKNPEEYEWSSYSFYSRGDKNNIIKEPSPLYLNMGNSNKERQRLYKEYILQERPYEHIVDEALRTA